MGVSNKISVFCQRGGGLSEEEIIFQNISSNITENWIDGVPMLSEQDGGVACERGGYLYFFWNNFASRFDIEFGIWETLPNAPTTLSLGSNGYSVQPAVLDDDIYFVSDPISGFEGSKFNITSGEWSRVPKPPFALRGCGAGVYKRKIYTHGYNGFSYVYDPDLSLWGNMATIANGVSSIVFNAFTIGELIYFMYERNGAIYDPTSDIQIGQIPSLSNTSPRTGWSCATLGRKIYQFGGSSEYYASKNTYYDIDIDMWTDALDMTLRGSWMGSVGYKNNIYNICGKRGTVSAGLYKSAKVEIYTPPTELKRFNLSGKCRMKYNKKVLISNVAKNEDEEFETEGVVTVEFINNDTSGYVKRKVEPLTIYTEL